MIRISAIAFALLSVSAAASCVGVSCVEGQEDNDVTSLVQVHNAVRVRSDRSDKDPKEERKDEETDEEDDVEESKPDPAELVSETAEAKVEDDAEESEPDPAELVSEIAEAKMMYKRRLAEREMASNKYDAGHDWAKHRIAEGKADLQEIEKKMDSSAQLAAMTSQAAKLIWAKATAQLLEAEDAIEAQGNEEERSAMKKDVEFFKERSEQHAVEALFKKLKDELDTKKTDAIVAAKASVTKDDLNADEASLVKLKNEMKAMRTEVDAAASSEEKKVLAKARSDQKAKSTTEKKTEDSAKLLQVKAHAASHDLDSEVANVLREVSDIADRARLTLYGDIQEHALRVSAAKMAFKKALILQRMDAKDFAKAQEHARGKIQEGETSLKTVAKNRAKATELAEKNVAEAKAAWEALAGEVKQALESEDTKKLKLMAEKKAEKLLNTKLVEEMITDFKNRVSKRSKAEQDAMVRDEEEAQKHIDSEWESLSKKIDAEVANQEELMAKEAQATQDTETAAVEDNAENKKK